MYLADLCIVLLSWFAAVFVRFAEKCVPCTPCQNTKQDCGFRLCFFLKERLFFKFPPVFPNNTFILSHLLQGFSPSAVDAKQILCLKAFLYCSWANIMSWIFLVALCNSIPATQFWVFGFIFCICCNIAAHKTWGQIKFSVSVATQIDGTASNF